MTQLFSKFGLIIKNKAKYLLPISLIIIVFVVVLLQPVYLLQIWDCEKKLKLYEWRVSCGDVFCYDFIHSIEKKPVWEYYYVTEDCNIALKELRFKAFGYDNKDLTYPIGYSIDNGTGIIEDIDKNYGEIWDKITIRVTGIVPQRLQVDGKYYMLNSFSTTGSLLELKVVQRPAILTSSKIKIS